MEFTKNLIKNLIAKKYFDKRLFTTTMLIAMLIIAMLIIFSANGFALPIKKEFKYLIQNDVLYHHNAIGLNKFEDNVYNCNASVDIAVLDTMKKEEKNFAHGNYILNIIQNKNKNFNLIHGILSNANLNFYNLSSKPNVKEVYNVLEKVIAKSPDVINLSFGFQDISQSPLDKLLKKAYAKDIIVVASAGNNSNDFLDYPANSPYTISVGGVNKDFKRTAFGNYGENLDFIAPSQSILTSNVKGNPTVISGTSFGTAIITAIVGAIKSKRPDYSLDEVKTLLKVYSKDLNEKGWDRYTGWGLPKLNLIINNI